MTTYGKQSADPAVVYTKSHSLRLLPVQQRLQEETLALPMGRMLGSAEELQLLQNLVRSIGAKKTLDIGVFTGYSALSIALALPDDGHVIACDIDDKMVDQIGRKYWKEAGVEHKIRFVKAPATTTLQNLLDSGEAGTFDFAFIDADKDNYDNYYELSLKLLRKNGIIAVDNSLWGGRVFDPAVNDSSTLAIRALNEKVYNDDRVNVSFLIIGDGTLLAFKK